MSAELRAQKVSDAQCHLDDLGEQSGIDWNSEIRNFIKKEGTSLGANLASVGLYVYFRKRPTSLADAVKHFHAEVLDRAGRPYLDNPFAWGSSVAAFWSFCQTCGRAHDANKARR